MPRYFWVNQGDSFEEARRANCLWAPERDAAGLTPDHWKTMSELKPGDVVFTYSKLFLRGYALVRSEAVNSLSPYQSDSSYQPAQGGLLAICEFKDLPSGKIGIGTITSDPKLRTSLGSVLTKKGTVAQKYLSVLSGDAASKILALAQLPSTVEGTPRIKPADVLALVNARVGQGKFRDQLLEAFDRKCAVTGLPVERLLRASHVQPWAECINDEQKLDPNNGILLAAGIDAAFDWGFISFEDDGSIKVSPHLTSSDLTHLGIPIGGSLNARHLNEARKAYLAYHRSRVFDKRWKKKKKALCDEMSCD